jgi:Putative endonuclease segE, GIY-YIG domain
MWLYNNKEFTEEDIGDSFGFVYLIENNLNGRKYVGKKFFTRAGTKQIKGKKKKVRLSSGWSDYWSSSKELQDDVKKIGKENFKRTILYLCKSRSECSYRETKEIFIRDALLSENYYNSWVSCKIHKAHVLNKL